MEKENTKKEYSLLSIVDLYELEKRTGVNLFNHNFNKNYDKVLENYNKFRSEKVEPFLKAVENKKLNQREEEHIKKLEIELKMKELSLKKAKSEDFKELSILIFGEDIGEEEISTIVNLSFLKNFNIPDKSKDSDDKAKRVLWFLTYGLTELGLSYADLKMMPVGTFMDILTQRNYLFPKTIKRDATEEDLKKMTYKNNKK